MDFRAIRQTSHISGVNRNPGIAEHECAMVWDNNVVNPDGTFGKIKYISYTSLSPNSKTNNGYVAKGDDSVAANYIWKLDGTKNPAWRQEEYLASIARSVNAAIFTMNSGATKTLSLGALAWLDTVSGLVTSVFGRTGDVIASAGDYTAAQVTNAFNKPVDTLDVILEGITNKHFTATYKSNVDANTSARHTHSNKSVLDLITNAGGGIIPSSAQITEWDTFSLVDAQNVIDTVVALIQNNTGISFVYDGILKRLTPTINLGAFTTDSLPQGVTHLYYDPSLYKNVYTITLPSAATVALRCSGAVSGTDYPTGWTISAGVSDVDLLITHNLNRKIAGVTIFSTTIDGDRQLFGNAAYSGVLAPASIPTNGQLLVEALATITTPIIVQLVFGESIASVPPIPPVITSLPVVQTNTPYSITSTSFMSGGTVVSDGNAAVTERGICYSLSPTPTIADYKTMSGSGIGSFSCLTSSLTPNTVYYYRAYATNSVDTAYGYEIWFITPV